MAHLPFGLFAKNGGANYKRDEALSATGLSAQPEYCRTASLQ